MASAAAAEPAPPPGPAASRGKPGAGVAPGAAAKVVVDDDPPMNGPTRVGLTMFSLTYVPCLLLGPLTEKADLMPLMVPFVGPLLTASLSKMSDPGWVIFGSVAGLQTVGAAILAFGLLLPKEPVRPASAKPKSSFSVSAAPLITPTAWGVSAGGSF